MPLNLKFPGKDKIENSRATLIAATSNSNTTLIIKFIHLGANLTKTPYSLLLTRGRYSVQNQASEL